MTHRPSWWSGSGVLLICIILAGALTNMVIRTPNTVGGGAGMMFVIIVLAVIFKATFQFFMSRWQKRGDEKLTSDAYPQDISADESVLGFQHVLIDGIGDPMAGRIHIVPVPVVARILGSSDVLIKIYDLRDRKKVAYSHRRLGA